MPEPFGPNVMSDGTRLFYIDEDGDKLTVERYSDGSMVVFVNDEAVRMTPEAVAALIKVSSI